MKANPNKPRFLLLTTATSLLVGLAGQASTITKLDNANLLTDPLSWSGGTAPGSGDIAQFTGATA